MAKNKIQAGVLLELTVGSTVKSGDPVVVGNAICGVAQTDYNTTSTKAIIDTEGVYDLSVKGINDDGNSAVAIGDRIYHVTGDTPVLSKKSSGKLFGVALEAIAGGSTATINVKIAPIGEAGAVIAEVTASAAELNKLEGAGAVVASGTPAAHVANANVAYTTGDLDDESEIIAAFNTTNGKINSILSALEAFQINAAS